MDNVLDIYKHVNSKMATALRKVGRCGTNVNWRRAAFLPRKSYSTSIALLLKQGESLGSKFSELKGVPSIYQLSVVQRLSASLDLWRVLYTSCESRVTL